MSSALKDDRIEAIERIAIEHERTEREWLAEHGVVMGHKQGFLARVRRYNGKLCRHGQRDCVLRDQRLRVVEVAPGARHNEGMRSRSEAKHAASTRVDESPESSPTVTTETSPSVEKRTSYDFPNVNRAKGKTLRPDLARVVEETFVVDLYAEWKDLEAGLEVGEKRSEHAYALRELDKAAFRAQRAHRLYLTARAAREEWEAENEVIFGAMVSQATHSLQQEKDAGLRSKQITDADVRARVATLFPDEWRTQEKRRRDVELTVKSLERLAELWMGKCRDLQALVGKLR